MTDECITPLRQRMIEDMSLRHFGEKTQKDYIRAVKNLKIFLQRSPDTASNEDLRLFQLHLAENRVGAPTINSTVSALRFFFTVTLDRADAVRHLTFVHEPRKLPVVLSPRGGGAFPGGRPRRQVQGRVQRRLWCWPARIRGCIAEGVRHRQEAHAAADRAGQGPQGSLRDGATKSLAIPGPRSAATDVDTPAQP